MLTITIPATEEYDDAREEFIETREQTLTLEHSLVSISKWESKWHKPFLGKEEKTKEETLDYIRCMTITKNVDPNVYYALTPDIIKQINDYIENPMTATWFSDRHKGPKNREVITSELIYYWMTALQIPFECDKWHFNRLMTLIQVASIKSQPPKKMGKKEAMNQQRMLNAARRAKTGSRG